MATNLKPLNPILKDSHMPRELKLWNGPGNTLRKEGDPLWEGVRGNAFSRACVAAYSRAEARRIIFQYLGRDIGDGEIRDYWSNCWGKEMAHVTPERGLWIDVGPGPVRVV